MPGARERHWLHVKAHTTSLILCLCFAGPVAGDYVRGDFNRDQRVDFDDLTFLARNWLYGRCVAPACEADLDYARGVTFTDLSILAENWRTPEALVGTERPTNAGILRLAREWRWCECSDVNEIVPFRGWTCESLAPISQGMVDFDKLNASWQPDKLKCHRILWKAFRVPLDWRGKTVWFTYDTRRFNTARPQEVLLNGRPVPVRLCTYAYGFNKGEWGAVTEPPENLTHLFADVGPYLRFDRPNIVALRIIKWTPDRNSGVWIYCTPEKERVLFLNTPEVSATARQMIDDYASSVAKVFDVEPIIRTASFQTADEQRAYVTSCYYSDRISGAIFIGQFPRFAKQPPGGCPRYYEDLDADFVDVDGNDAFDWVDISANFGCEIWTSWIRLIPTREHLFVPYLQKILDYYAGRFCFPDEPVARDWRDGVWERNPWPERGIYDFDALMRPSDFIEVTGHGGVAIGPGPHTAVRPDDIRERIYPGSITMFLGGCETGLFGSELEQTEARTAEKYLFGRSLTQVVSANARGGTLRMKPNVPGWAEALLEVCPHFGIFHCWKTDMWGETEPGVNRTYEDSGDTLLGNPFVGLHRVPVADWGSISGKVSAIASDRVEGFYVSVTLDTGPDSRDPDPRSRDGKWLGRVRTSDTGEYQLDYLAPGQYNVELHLNALESMQSTATVFTGRRRQVNWQLPRLWRVSGTILDPNGVANHRGWVEMSARPDPWKPYFYDLFGVCPDEQGRFELFGAEPATFYLTSRIKFGGDYYRSEPNSVTVGGSESLDVGSLWAREPDKAE
ncbi:MAG: hypothetical protein JSU70_17220 [Phycisphaerales bacterium]|nr:MAG: hypothetical protein JSU70_17220 [Phycisphaerales bacterium]